MKKFWIIASVAVLASVGAVAFTHAQGATEQEAGSQEAAQQEAPQQEADGRVQPIQFRHDVHVETYQMDCQYCHYSASRSVDAGLPSVQTCMGCHTVVGGETEAQQAEIQKLRDHYQSGEPIEWVRIYKISDHAHFPHMRHVDAGLSCQQCHGQVETMGPIEERDPLWGGESMGWCVSCHVELDVSRDCTVCHY